MIDWVVPEIWVSGFGCAGEKWVQAPVKQGFSSFFAIFPDFFIVGHAKGAAFIYAKNLAKIEDNTQSHFSIIYQNNLSTKHVKNLVVNLCPMR